MSKKAQSRIGMVSMGMLTGALMLSGCAGFRVHDESKAIVTAGVKEKYTQADVVGVIDVEKKNLDNLLAEELKVVRDNHKLQVDFALLSIANDNTPMADTYTKEATGRLKEIGYADGFKQVRMSLLVDVDRSVGQREMETYSGLIKRLTDKTPPPCRPGEALPEKMTFPESLPDNVREGAENFYRLYREQCDRLQKLAKNKAPDGQIKQAFDEWQTARAELLNKNQSLDEAQKNLKEKRDAYNQALEALNKVKGSGDKLEQDLKDRIASLLKDLESAIEHADSVDPGIVPKERLNATITLLTAAAGGKIDTSEPKIKKAATILKELPSLAGDIKGLLDQAKAPSVNNLLIEMRHQVLLLEYAKQLGTLAQQRVDILKTKSDALKEEARYWLAFGDAICSYSVLMRADMEFPGQRCDAFSVPSSGTCMLGSELISNCALDKPWNASIQATSNTAAKRELYKALAAYLRALAVQAKPAEQDFRLIDVRNREILAARQSAIRGWDNLVAVPITQLDAYYQAGLKPAEIADLIVKALGFMAIAVGVSQ